jgi:hypothetical protein
MRGRTTLLLAALSVAIPVHETANAQLSPQGLIGGITHPLRQMLGHLGHFPRASRHRGAVSEPRTAAADSTNETPPIAGSRLGWVGPPAWPTAFEDVVGFTFWADDYAQRLHGRGFDVIADTISGRVDLPRSGARSATTGIAVNDASAAADRCGDTSSTQASWPAARVEQMLQLSDAQHEALEKLQAAARQSAKNIRTDCRDPGSQAPPDRLRALVQTLWVVRDGGISMRAPLKNFSDTLTTTQKTSFGERQPQNSVPPDAQAANGETNKLYQACAMQNAERAERLVKEIEMRVRPKKDQAASFESFHKVSADMAKLLIASCAQPVPADPMARLDSADDQLTAMNYAATTVQVAFDDFYGKLDNEQKARFDSLSR